MREYFYNADNLTPGQEYRLYEPHNEQMINQLYNGFHIFKGYANVRETLYDQLIFKNGYDNILIRFIDLPGGRDEVFVSPQKSLKNVIDKKSTNAEIRGVYERMTHQSGAPGHGPANIIRKMVDITVPRGAEGGRFVRTTNKKRKTHRRRKRTRKSA